MTMNLSTPVSPHWHAGGSVRHVMLQVLYALVPGIAVYVWFFGWGIVLHIGLATLAAVIAEAAMLRARGRPLKPYLTDGSAVVTAVLLALAIPSVAPWWLTVVGTAFAIIVAKHLYGGLGYNPFNPAMVGYVALIISFPREMTVWPAADAVSGFYIGLRESVRIVFAGEAATVTTDAFTGATPLDYMKTQLSLNQTVTEIQGSPVFGDFGGKGWEWMANAFFLGGLWLLYRRVITWHIPVAVLGSLIVVSVLFSSIDADAYPSPMFHVFSGGAMLGAFFVATDPVSAATTVRGRLVYGAGIGVLTYVIRTWGGYPDGVAFAVLLMNMAAPTIDHYTQPRVYGRPRE